ncbi:MAG: MFS transporter [Sphingobium sp.]
MKSARGYGFLLLSAIVYAVNIIDRQLLPLMAEAVRKDIALSDWQMGLLTGISFAAFYALFTLPIAWIADSGNRRNLVAICLGVFSLATAACGFVQNFAQLVMARMAVAIGEAGTTPASLSMLADTFPDRKGFASGAFTAGGNLGLLGGVLLVSGMASQMGWRATFAITGLLGVVTAAIYMLVVREPVRLSPVVRQDYRQVLRRLGGHSSFRHTTLSMIGILFFTNATGAWTPAFLARAHGLSIAQAGLFVGLTSGLIGMICVLLTGPLIDRLARRDIRWMGWLPAIALTIMIASMAIGVRIEDTRIALPILAIAPCLALVPPTCIFAVLQTAIPAGLRASATAMLFLAANLLGMGIGPTLVGALSSYWETSSALSLRPALFFGILPSIVGVIACLLLARTIAGDVRTLADVSPPAP